MLDPATCMHAQPALAVPKTPSLLQVFADGSSDQSLIVEIVVSHSLASISWPAVITVAVLRFLLACHGHLATQGGQHPTCTSAINSHGTAAAGACRRG